MHDRDYSDALNMTVTDWHSLRHRIADMMRWAYRSGDDVLTLIKNA